MARGALAMSRSICGGDLAEEVRRPSALVALLGMVVLLASAPHATAASQKPDIFGI
jgi:hypothetical protein